jgi:hypothetical protein
LIAGDKQGQSYLPNVDTMGELVVHHDNSLVLGMEFDYFVDVTIHWRI